MVAKGIDKAAAMRNLENLNFDNLMLRAVPLDPIVNERATREVRGACYSRVEPSPLEQPELVAVSVPAMELIELDPDEAKRPEFSEYFGGNRLLPGSEPAAHCYCGHQFGNFAGQLGDGAAIYLGEVVNASGERWEVQLKGAGLTPYSRHADGRKVLRSSIREFLASEAMFHLGIPTTRALCCVTSNSRVERDIFYSGHPTLERCSVVCRLAPTFWRFGTFEIFKASDGMTGRSGPSHGLAGEMLPTMVDHCIRTYFPDIWQAYGGEQLGSAEAKQDMYCQWLREVFTRTAALVAGWQAVGFTHGVLNTDNISILGLTLDYGPYGFMDRYSPGYTPNHSDDASRYDYAKQREMVRWNCEQLCNALETLIPRSVSSIEVDAFDKEYERCYWRAFRNKLGLLEKEKDSDQLLINDLLATMESSGADFTNTFRLLARFPMPPGVVAGAGAASVSSAGGLGFGASPSPAAAVDPAIATSDDAMLRLRYDDGVVLQELLGSLASAKELAADAGPSIPMANLQMFMMLSARDPTILAAMGVSPSMLQSELAKVKKAEALTRMSDEEKGAADRTAWTKWLNRYGARLAAEAAAGASDDKRVRVMNSTNPRYVLRQWVAQYAIQQAEEGNYAAVQQVLAVLQHPFSDQSSSELAAAVMEGSGCIALPPLDGPVPDWGKALCVSCSS